MEFLSSTFLLDNKMKKIQNNIPKTNCLSC